MFNQVNSAVVTRETCMESSVAGHCCPDQSFAVVSSVSLEDVAFASYKKSLS